MNGWKAVGMGRLKYRNAEPSSMRANPCFVAHANCKHLVSELITERYVLLSGSTYPFTVTSESQTSNGVLELLAFQRL